MATSKNYSRSVVAASDELRDIYCEPCVDDGKQNEAEGFCVDCSEYLCGQCYKNHTRYKAFKQHVLQDKDKMPLFTTKADAKDVCVEKCSLHTTKIVEYFCRSCDTLGCHACITINHRLCKNVDHIPSIVKDLEKSEEFKVFINGLDIKLEAIKERKKTLCSKSNETDVMKGKAKAMLIQQRDEIKNFFDQLEADMNKRIEDIDRENKEILKAESSACDSIYDDLETIKSNSKIKLKDGHKCELFIAMKNAKPKTERLAKEFEKFIKESKIQSYVLVPSPQIKVMDSTSEICRLHKLRSAKYLHEINVCTKNDNKIPQIFGLVMVQNQYLAVADYNNTSVKMVDTRSMSVKSEMNMNCAYVWHITCMSDDKIAVNIIYGGYQHQIQFMSVSKEGSLSKGHLVNIDKTCYGLAYSRGNFIILQDQQVKIIDIHGKIQDTIKTDYSASLRGIAVSPDNESIYITNSEKNTVSSMTLDGKVNAIYKDLNVPESVTVDNDGMVYVCGPDSITLLTEDLIMVQVIEDVYCSRITYSSTDNRLYVGLQDVITVYQMEQLNSPYK